MYPALEVAADMMRRTSAKVKHVIALTDGQSSEADHLGITQRMVDDGCTVSTVALGDGSARELLSQMAEVGIGRYYETADPANVPQIFTRETMQASKSAINEDIFTPVVVTEHPVIGGVKAETLPATLGYVMAQPKASSQTLLAVETGDPLLAIGRFGLGTGLAYTSDLTERWGAEWLSWEQCGIFWSQVMRGVCRKVDVEGVETRSETRPDRWTLDITRTATDGTPVSDIRWDASLVDNSGTSQPVQVREIGLGRYQVTQPLHGESALTLRLSDTQHRKLIVRHHRASYPAEYQLGAEPASGLAEVPGFVPEKIVEGVAAILVPTSLRTQTWWLALALLLGSVVLRRI
jgi:hypothetical protein